ncbi:hypothetical protein LR48_Vigan02g214300 [Vigna angularis]|uniref:Uncharacterized protein n=1 Tax=Phaseolus angularis TaxID=3914 RepID=A0A0L9TZI8_PHAAN|nr:hypothetical protein LR48_Vigan02g214300 [Vigna angularis]
MPRSVCGGGVVVLEGFAVKKIEKLEGEVVVVEGVTPESESENVRSSALFGL